MGSNNFHKKSKSLFLRRKSAFSTFLSLVVLVILCLPIQAQSIQTQPTQSIKVGVYENPPKIYTKSNGDTAGIFSDILEVIAGKEGWALTYVPGTWKKCLERLESGEIDVMVDIAQSQERAKRFSFSGENVFLNWGTVYTKEGFTAESFLDLKGKTVAIMREDIHTIGDSGIQKLAEQFDLHLNYLPVNSYEEVLEMVSRGQADAGVVNRLFGAAREENYEIHKSPIVFNPVQLKFAFPKKKESEALVRKIDQHLNSLKSNPDSIFHKIVSSYLAGIEYDLRAHQEVKPFHFSKTELAWLRDHQKIRLGVDKNYAPYSYSDENDVYHGLAVDTIKLIARHLGVEIEIVKGLTWEQIIQGAKNKTIDAVLPAVETEERKDFLNFTQIFLPTPLVIMTRDEYDLIDGPEDLDGKSVALVTGYSSADKVLQEHRLIQPIMVDTPLSGLTAVSTGEADCYIGVLGVNDYQAQINGISNLKVAARYDMLLFGQGVGVRKDWPELATILDKALDAISEKKKIELRQTWISSNWSLEGPAALQEKYALSDEETQWVKENKDILLGIDPEFAPFEFYGKQGEYQGISSEYVKILNLRLGLNMQVVPGLTWNESIQKIKKGELDALPCIGKTVERNKYLKFSQPYMHYQRVIITRTDMPFIGSIEDIQELKIAVQSHTSHEGYLLENTNIKAETYPTLLETIKAVSEGKADAVVGNLATCIYLIQKENISNLKVAGPVTYSTEQLFFTVRKDLPQLISIINKGLSSISSKKEKMIREKWVQVKYNPGIHLKKILPYVVMGLVSLFIIFFVILFWNYRLKKEIVKRESVEEKLQEHKNVLEQTVERRTDDLKQTNSRLLTEIRDRQNAEQENQTLQRQLFQVHKMESIGTLAGGIAHDFNNILSAIIGYTEMAKMGSDIDSMTSQRLDRVLEAGHRAKGLVQQILTFSRQADTEPIALAPAAIVEEVLQMLRPTLPATIEISQDINTETRNIYADPTQINQVLLNLCTNAYHAMEKTGGTLTVSLTEKFFSLDDIPNETNCKSGSYIQISVKDSGPGIPKIIQEKIFDPYFTTKPIGKGTGMGLSIVHGIVNHAGGFVVLESDVKTGTTFNIFLPIFETKVSIDEDTPSSIHGRKEKILFVDDEESIAYMNKELLEGLGYQVTTRTNSHDALKLFQEQPDLFDLVITDQTMPSMTGVDLAKAILQLRPNIPIILCTGYSSLIDRKTAQSLGIKGFALKPTSLVEFSKLIRKLVSV